MYTILIILQIKLGNLIFVILQILLVGFSQKKSRVHLVTVICNINKTKEPVYSYFLHYMMYIIYKILKK